MKLQRLIEKFMSARTESEVYIILTANVETMFEYPELYIYASNALRRIQLIEEEKKKSWQIYQMN